MIDVMSAVSSAATIKAKPTVYFTDSQRLSMSASTGLSVSDLFSGILGYFSTPTEILRGETSFTMDC
jgi:hypothetical protein